MQKKPKARRNAAPSRELFAQSAQQPSTSEQRTNLPAKASRVESPLADVAGTKTTDVVALQSGLGANKYASRVAELFKPWMHRIEHFFSPCIAGAATAGLLYLLDAVKPVHGAAEGLSEKFVQGSLEHVHAEVLILGPFLLSLCVALVGAAVPRLLRRWLVLPLIQLGHHIFLAAAGALIAFLILPHAENMPANVTAQLLWGIVFLFLGGAEMQGAEVVAKMPDEAITKCLGQWPAVLLGLISTAGFGWLLWQQLAVAH